MAILIKRIISFLVFLFFGYVFYKIVIKGESLFRSRSSKKNTSGSGGVEKMEKDPVCGTYVPEKTSLKLKSEGEIYHFCSEKCREEYIAQLKK
ncbi:MAG: YHS domain-containing protein [Acidobacteriota bacterium]